MVVGAWAKTGAAGPLPAGPSTGTGRPERAHARLRDGTAGADRRLRRGRGPGLPQSPPVKSTSSSRPASAATAANTSSGGAARATSVATRAVSPAPRRSAHQATRRPQTEAKPWGCTWRTSRSPSGGTPGTVRSSRLAAGPRRARRCGKRPIAGRVPRSPDHFGAPPFSPKPSGGGQPPSLCCALDLIASWSPSVVH